MSKAGRFKGGIDVGALAAETGQLGLSNISNGLSNGNGSITSPQPPPTYPRQPLNDAQSIGSSVVSMSSVSTVTTRSSPENYVGFANLPNQVYRRSVKQGFEFTILVAGTSGLGKSTLIDTLFLTDVYDPGNSGSSEVKRASKGQTIGIEEHKLLLKEGSVQLRLTVVDTPGFGDSVDNSNCWQTVLRYIQQKYEKYLSNESMVNRPTKVRDERVHCCLYFIQPTGHGLKALDIEFMKKIHDKVNIIPIIAKADSLTAEECRSFKRRILEEIKGNGIKIYVFPDIPDDDDAKRSGPYRGQRPKDRVPFAVIGSNMFVEGGNGRKIRARRYPWGIVEVDNLEHNDFPALREMLIRSHLQDLVDVTGGVHYENFRIVKLAGSDEGAMDNSPFSQLESDDKEKAGKLRKMQADLEHAFEDNVRKKEQKLKASEQDLVQREKQLDAEIETKKREIQETRERFMIEKGQMESNPEFMSFQGSTDSLNSKPAKSSKSKLFGNH